MLFHNFPVENKMHQIFRFAVGIGHTLHRPLDSDG